MKHSNVVSGSTLSRRMHCPGSYAAEKDAPDGQTSDAAEIGTMAHEASEVCLLEGVDPSSLVGRIFNGRRLEADYIADKLEPAIEHWKFFIQAYRVREFEVESSVHIPALHEHAYGYADVCGSTKDGAAFILDWKYGEGEVDPTENLQLAFYALGAIYTQETRDLVENADTWHLAIIQPAYGAQEILKVWTTTRAWLDQVLADAQKAVARQFQPDAPRIPGSHCRWCKARAMCTEFAGSMSSLAVQPPNPKDLKALGAALDAIPMLKAYIAAVEELGFKRALDGHPPKGYKVVEKRAQRRWVEEPVVERMLQDLGHDPYERKLVSPAQAEKKVGKKAFREHFDALVTQTASGVTLVPESDKRPEIHAGFAGLPSGESPFK